MPLRGFDTLGSKVILGIENQQYTLLFKSVKLNLNDEWGVDPDGIDDALKLEDLFIV